MKYEIEVWLVNGAAIPDIIEARGDIDPRDVMDGAWKTPVQVAVERLAREGYHLSSDIYPNFPHTYHPPHSIQRITYREAT